MVTRTHITIFLLLTVIVWGGTLWLLGIPVSFDDAKPYALTGTVLSAICVVFDRWLWHWPIFKGWLVQLPYVQGTWKLTLQSSWIDPETQQEVPPIQGVVVIRQRFSALSYRLYTKESSAFLIAHKLVLQDDGIFQLTGVYQNIPDIHLRGKRSEIHYGAILLEVRGDPPTELEGHYWTDRTTKGSLQLTDRCSELASNYADGAKLYKY